MDLHEVRKNVRQVVQRDLQPPFSKRLLKIGLAAILGGLLSLTICGQFGFGLTSWAQAFSSHIHEKMEPWLCSVICGVLFAVFPVVLLRVLSSPMLFHVLIKKHFYEVGAIFATAGAGLAVVGHHGNSLDLFVVWMVAAIGTVAMVSRLIEWWVPQFQFAMFEYRE